MSASDFTGFNPNVGGGGYELAMMRSSCLIGKCSS
jgi:hypothetical protein